jgi:hypothetical protein
LHLSLLAETVAVDDLLVRIREHKDRTTNMLEDAHERTAFVYEYFLNAVTDNKLKKIALKRSGYHIAEASINNLREGEYLQTIKKIKKAFINGDRLRHLASVMKRGMFERYRIFSTKK